MAMSKNISNWDSYHTNNMEYFFYDNIIYSGNLSQTNIFNTKINYLTRQLRSDRDKYRSDIKAIDITQLKLKQIT